MTIIKKIACIGIIMLVQIITASANIDQVRQQLVKVVPEIAQTKETVTKEIIITNGGDAVQMVEQGRKEVKAYLKASGISTKKCGITDTYTSDEAEELLLPFVVGHKLDSIKAVETQATKSAMDVQSKCLTYIVLGFGLIAMLLLFFFTVARKTELSPASLRMIGMFFIASAALCLITAGFDNAQITPVIGILGTMAGYVLSSHSTPSTAPADPPAGS